MRKKIIATLMALTMTMSMGITSFAAPVKTADGGVFDAEYYAQNNPDVVAAFGTDANALYAHFVKYGVNEGRLPFAPGTDWQSILNSTSTATVSTSTATTATTASTATPYKVGNNKGTLTYYYNTDCPYELYKVYDEGGYNVYYYGYCGFDNYDKSSAHTYDTIYKGSEGVLKVINERFGTNYTCTATVEGSPCEVYSDTGCVRKFGLLR